MLDFIMGGVKVPQLETERLILRNWSLKDAQDLYEYAKDPDVGPNAGWQPHRSVYDSSFIIRNIFKSNSTWAIEEKSTGKVVGSIGLDKDMYREGINSREMGYSLAKRCWGQGYMPEAAGRIIEYAFEDLKLDILMIKTATTNFRSQRVIEKKNFTYEGTLRSAHRMYDGTIRDLKCYSMTREEYLKIVDSNQKV